MNGLELSSDVPIARWGPIILNSTIVFTWVVMAVMTMLAWIVTRRLRSNTIQQPEPTALASGVHGEKIEQHQPAVSAVGSGNLTAKTRLVPQSRLQNLMEVLVSALRDQIREISGQSPDPYLPFVGTLFLFLAFANLMSIVPGYVAPTASLSTTAALAACVFVAVPVFGISHLGFGNYLKQYLRPSIFMLPFNLIGELSRTLALAVRLYGNMMSGTVIAAILLSFVPLFVPILAQTFGLLTGMIQAYIFSILAMVYIASATRQQQ